VTATLRILTWHGMPAAEALSAAAAGAGCALDLQAISSNEDLEARMAAQEPFDLVFPSDYMVERLRGEGRIAPLDRDRLPRLELLAPWAREVSYDPGCAHSVPFAYGTTGFLHDERLAAADSWHDLLAPADGIRVGMLDEVREVVGAALLATGASLNATDADSLAAARQVLEYQHGSVERYDSDDFTEPVEAGTVAAHHAWSGPAALAVRRQPRLRYVIPVEGATLWVTAAAIPADAPDIERSHAFLHALMAPERAALATATGGYATPNDAARARLEPALRDDATLFPPPDVLARCEVVSDLGPEGEAALAAVFAAVVGPERV
jgi:spermidine/putrescine transport system substrate-binding protein